MLKDQEIRVMKSTFYIVLLQCNTSNYWDHYNQKHWVAPVH
uniref:Uncharacterized protein n=1 Tax=Rhizophora mucronata TaxID=61149 RepID=A0A2P2P4L6_RHIMU